MTDLQIVYVVVFAVMSIVGFLSMYVDKTKAKRRKMAYARMGAVSDRRAFRRRRLDCRHVRFQT